MNEPSEPSDLVVGAHLALTLALAVLFVRGVFLAGAKRGVDGAARKRRAAIFALVLAAWLGASYRIAASGYFLDFDARPPRILFLLAPGLVAAAVLALSSFGRALLDGLPLASLIGFQAFRVIVELLLWQLHREGVIPVQMTFEGANYDVLTGLSALLVAGLASRATTPRLVLWIWNLGGLALLARIVTIAVRSMPGPFFSYVDEPANTIVLHTVFVWIPAFYVLAAWFGHVLVFRALLRRERAG